MAQEALHRPGRGLAEGTDRMALDLPGARAQHLDVGQRRPALDHSAHHAVHPARALAARRALATGFLPVEARNALAGTHHAGAVVHHDHRARTQARARLLQGVVVHGQFHHRGARQHRHGRTTRDHALEGAPRAQAAGNLQQFGERRAEADLVVAGALHVAGHREDLAAAVVRLAEVEEPLGAVADDGRHRGVGLGVVDRGRLAEQAEVRRERRLVARLSLLALERLHQGGLLAADVGARAQRVVHVDVDAAAEDVLAQPAVRIGFRQCLFEMFEGLVVELATQVVVGDRRTGGIAGDRHALDHRVRVVAQDVAILRGARLRFVGVAQDVLLHVALGHEAPLQAGREARAATAAQARLLDHLDDVGRRDLLGQDPAQRLVATGLEVVIVRPRLVEVQRRVDGLVLLRRGADGAVAFGDVGVDRKSTRLNSSHVRISYAVFCLKKKTTSTTSTVRQTLLFILLNLLFPLTFSYTSFSVLSVFPPLSYHLLRAAQYSIYVDVSTEH